MALFGGLGAGGGELDAVGDALVAERGFGVVEVLLEEAEVGGAGGDEGAVADDGDEVFGEGVGYAEEVAAGDGAVGVGAGGADVAIRPVRGRWSWDCCSRLGVPGGRQKRWVGPSALWFV